MLNAERRSNSEADQSLSDLSQTFTNGLSQYCDAYEQIPVGCSSHGSIWLLMWVHAERGDGSTSNQDGAWTASISLKALWSSTRSIKHDRMQQQWEISRSTSGLSRNDAMEAVKC